LEAGIIDRSHPSLAFLGYASDNICNSLGMVEDEINPMERVSIEHSVILSHTVGIKFATHVMKAMEQ
jgi:hypothetical protein